jgi:hypothetical protein
MIYFNWISLFEGQIDFFRNSLIATTLTGNRSGSFIGLEYRKDKKREFVDINKNGTPFHPEWVN